MKQFYYLLFACIAFLACACSKDKYNELLTNADKYIQNAEYTSAIEELNDAIALLPKSEEAYFRLYDVYFQLGNYSDAAQIMINADDNIKDKETKKKINDKLDEVSEIIKKEIEKGR